MGSGEFRPVAPAWDIRADSTRAHMGHRDRMNNLWWDLGAALMVRRRQWSLSDTFVVSIVDSHDYGLHGRRSRHIEEGARNTTAAVTYHCAHSVIRR